MEGSITLTRSERADADSGEGLSEAAHAEAVALTGPSAVWAAIESQPPITPELDAERVDLIERSHGELEQA